VSLRYFLADPEELKRAQAAVAAQSVVEKSKGVFTPGTFTTCLQL